MKNISEQFNETALTGLRQFATLRAKQSRISLPFLTLTEYDCFRRGPSCKCEGLRLFYLEKKNMRKLSKMKRSRMEISGQNLGTVNDLIEKVDLRGKVLLVGLRRKEQEGQEDEK